MFIYNVKVNGSKVFKIFFTGIVILIIGIMAVVSYQVFNGASNSSNNSSCVPTSKITNISPKNYTNILKAVHDDIDSYVGLNIHFTGYVYRVYDLNENQFILARNMIISSDFQYVVVGFLCECENAKNFIDNSWVEITGEITKGDYHGDMPIIKIKDIKNTTEPSSEEYVYPPDDSYIPTSGIL